MAVNSAELLNVACFDATTLICCAEQTRQRGEAHCLKLLKHMGTSAPLHGKAPLFFFFKQTDVTWLVFVPPPSRDAAILSRALRVEWPLFVPDASGCEEIVSAT